MTVTVYSKPSCVQCEYTQRLLGKLGVHYTVVDLTQDPDAFGYVTKELGHFQAPVVTAGADHWSGFRPDRITRLAESLRISA